MNKVFDDKAKVMNYLTGHYIEENDPRAARKKKIIREAVDEIFMIRYFPKDPDSASWYRKKVFQILEKAEARLERLKAREKAA